MHIAVVRFCIVGTVLAGNCGVVVQEASAQLVYKLVDGAAGDQVGHTLSGFIEFNSACGRACTANNITDFSFNVSGLLNFGASYARPDDITIVNGMDHLEVTSSSIILHSRTVGQLAIGDSTKQHAYVQWVGGQNRIYRAVGPEANTAWLVNSRDSIIAVAVPEPCASVLALVAMSLIGLTRFRRHSA